jgi:hypothetical protein
MTKDDVIRMAREAGCDIAWADSLERFAKLVADYEWNRAIGIAKGMQEELQAKFEQTYMEGVIAGAAAERERLAKALDHQCRGMSDYFEVKWIRELATALRRNQ